MLILGQLKAQDLGSSIQIFHMYDLDQCESMVKDATQKGAVSLNFIPTFYVSLNNNREAKEFYFKDRNAKAFKLDSEVLQNIKEKLHQCIRSSKLKNLSLTPHIDDLSGKLWRFFIAMDPQKKYGELKYSDIIKSLELKDINYFISSEMEDSYFNHHQKYFALSKELTKSKSGINFNYNRNRRTPSYKYDFVGVSNYAPLKRNIDKSFFEKQLKRLKRELSKHGMDKLKIYYNEIGLGGAGSFSRMLRKPFEGVSGVFRIETNPWNSIQKDQYRKNYYQALLNFLRLNRIEGVYLWNLDSFDVQGIYPYTKGYEDNEIIDQIRIHNLNY